MSDLPSRPPGHIVGEIGATTAQLQFKKWGWTADLIDSDYGEDLHCNIFIDDLRTNLHFRCQVKSVSTGSSYVRRLKSGDFSVRINTSALRAWLFSYFPVLLVVYDEENQESYWANATEQIRSTPEVLGQITATIHVSRTAVLREDREKIQRLVQRFYEGMLRLSSSSIGCDVYPILMPGYRGIPFQDWTSSLQLDSFPELHSRMTFSAKESLPAWATVLKTLEPHGLAGWHLAIDGQDLDTFIGLVRQVFSLTAADLENGEWVAFVCSPVLISTRGDEELNDSFWSRELTGWWSYSLVGSRVVSDHDYAFGVPQRYLHQVARRARSWETFHHVDPERDLAIQLFATVATTPSYRMEVATFRQHIIAQFLPWECPCDETDVLREALASIGLCFRAVEYFPVEDNVTVGVISSPLFEPYLGLFPMARNWREFSRGSILERLEEEELLGSIPGSPGSSEVRDLILQAFHSFVEEPTDRVLVSERDYIPGLPIDHSGRIIWVQRFRMMEDLDQELAENQLEESRVRLAQSLPPSQRVDTKFEIVDTSWPRPIYALSIYWEPVLEESSSESFNRFAQIIIEAFDGLMPRQITGHGELQTSYDVLRFAGEVFFEDQGYFSSASE